MPGLSPFERAVVRVARSAADILRVRAEGSAELPHQRAALDKAVAEMERLRPDVKRDLQNVFTTDRTTIDEAANGRPQRAIRAMALEAELRDPAKRADKFVARWDKLQKQAQHGYVAGDVTSHKAMRSEMRAWRRASNETRRWNRFSQLAKRSSGSRSTPAADWGRNWRSITGSTSEEVAGLDAEAVSALRLNISHPRSSTRCLKADHSHR